MFRPEPVVQKALSLAHRTTDGSRLSAFRHALPVVLLCALLWGSAFPIIKTVYADWAGRGLERTPAMVFLFAGIRFTLAGAGLLFLGGSLRSEFRKTPTAALLGFALAQTFLQYLCFYQAIAVSSASLAALLVATGSFWWMLLAPLMGGSPWPKTSHWCGLAIGGIGVTLAVYAPGAGAGNPMLGAGLMLIATAAGAVAVILFGRVRPTMSAVNATGLSLLGGGLALSAIGLPATGSLRDMFTVGVSIATLWLAFVSAAAFSIWNHLTTVHPVHLLASYRFLIPVCGVLESLLFLRGESAGWGLLAGGTLVVTSMFIAQRSTSKVEVIDSSRSTR